MKEVTTPQRTDMRRRREAGETLREIAVAVGKARTTVYDHVRDIPWPPKKP